MPLVFKHLKDFMLICNVVHFPEKVTCSYRIVQNFDGGKSDEI